MKNLKKLLVLIMAIVLTVSPIAAHAAVVDIYGNAAEVKVTTITSLDDIDKITAADNMRMMMFDIGQKEEVVPVQIEKRGLVNLVGSYITAETSYASAEINLYSDEACTAKIGYTMYCSANKEELESKNYFIAKEGTYYLKFTRNKDLVQDGIQFALIHYDGSDRTLKNNKVSIAASDYDHKDIYYKVTASKAGQFKVDMTFLEDSGYSSVTLMNSKKKAISDTISLRSSGDLSAYFSVQKGTYYIKVSTSSGIYGILSNLTAVTDKSGASKSKAAKLTKGGKAIKGMAALTDKQTKVDWFRVTLPRKQSVTFELKGTCSGGVKMEIVAANGGTIFFNSKTMYSPGGTITLKSDGAWSKGTYYIKVTKSNAKSSGTYQVRVK